MGLLFLASCSATSPTGLAVRPCDIITQTHVAAFQCEVADDAAKQEIGLKGRKSLPSNRAMLFPFESPRRANFWMKDTLIPLDIIFIDADGVIESIVANATPMDETLLSSKGEVVAAVEINGGEAARRQIRVGDKLRSRDRFGTN